MKTYKTAKAILVHSLQDIEDGLWCKDSLAVYGTCKWGRSIPASNVTSGDIENEGFYADATEANLYKRPMGCALGLVSMHGGHGSAISAKVNGHMLHSFLPLWPGDGYASEGVADAVRALFLALPKRHRYLDSEGVEECRIGELEPGIYGYNDSSGCTRKNAVKWFGRALESVS